MKPQTTLGLIFPLAVASILSGCGSDELIGAGTAAVINGKDFSGSYTLSGVECYNSSGITALAGRNSGSASSQIVVSGNTRSSTSTGSTCTVRSSASIVFTEQGSSSGVSYGQVTMGATTASITGGSSCTLTTSFTAVTGSPSITPSSVSSTYSNGTAIPAVTADYLRDTDGTILLSSVIQVVGSPSDYCFFSYVKL